MQIDDLPLFNQDNETNPTPAVTRIKAADRGGGRRALRDAGAQPLHSRRAEERHRLGDAAVRTSAFKGKVGAIIGTSRGRISTAVAQSHLRTIAGCQLDAMLTLPEVYINFTDTLVDVDANVTDEAVRKLLVRFIDGLARLVDRNAKA